MDTVTGDQNHHRRDWCSLGYDLTHHIFRRYLTFPDLLRCRNVCTTWRSVSHTILSSSPINSPVLFLPKSCLPQQQNIISSNGDFFENNTFHLCCFFNPVACELYPLSDKSKQLLTGRRVVGLSKGWALFYGFDDGDLVLFNAPTGVSIRMPCPVVPSYEIKKAVFWGGDPILDAKRNDHSHGIVAMTKTRPPDITFGIWGDTRTKHTIPDLKYLLHDVIYFNGLVYGVFSKGHIQAWDSSNQIVDSFDGFTPTKVEHFLPSFNTGKDLAPRNELHLELHLVDSSGELWLVSKLGLQTMSKIGVYKLDFKEKKWVDIESLGDRVVVLCKNQSIAFSPLGTSKYKRNCVYFEDYYDGSTSWYRRSCMYVYNLEDGSTVERLL